MGSLAKDCFQPSVNRISLKTLEKQPTVFTQLYVDLQLKTQGLELEIRIKYILILISCDVATMVTNKSKINLFHDSYTKFISMTPTLCDSVPVSNTLDWLVSHLIYLNLTKPTMQQCFHSKCETFALQIHHTQFCQTFFSC